MNTSKKIEISKSSLVSLKAELSRKQEEVTKAKAASGAGFIHPLPRPKKKTIWTKKNEGVDARDERDVEEIREEENAHKKSRAALEVKSKLYDRLAQASSSSFPDEENRYLVDFQQKTAVAESSRAQPEPEEEEEQQGSDDYDDNCDPEDDWVDYIDCLGRTRRCLRRDMDFVKSKDSQLAKSLNMIPPGDTDDNRSSVPEEKAEGEESSAKEPEMVSSDMRREQMRQKWEQQEEALRDKTDIHYQDVLFDEARAHGVGYFAFSQQEAVRSAQQEALNRQRQDTQRQQQRARELRERREKQLQARLQAARARNRTRLGLPPEEPKPEPTVEELQTAAEAEAGAKKAAEEEEEAAKAAKRAQAPRKPPPVRQWDLGKEGVGRPFEPMSQEEWVKKKRDERPTEFAPTYKESDSAVGSESWVLDKEPSTLFFSSKKNKKSMAEVPGSSEQSQQSSFSGAKSTLFSSKRASLLSQEDVVPQPTLQMKRTKIRNEVSNSSSSEDEEEEDTRGRGAEIGPPPPHAYSNPPPSFPRTYGGLSKDDLEKSITAGLAKLRREHEERRRRGEEMPVDLM